MGAKAWEFECCVCHRVIDSKQESMWTKVEGWTMKRRGGGANQIVKPKQMNEYMCRTCMDHKKAEPWPEQSGLF
jgi:hypothetical protein